MGNIFGRPKTVQQIVPSMDEEKTEAEKAAKKQRLLCTEGQNKGQQLQANQGAGVRKVFGN